MKYSSVSLIVVTLALGCDTTGSDRRGVSEGEESGGSGGVRSNVGGSGSVGGQAGGARGSGGSGTPSGGNRAGGGRLAGDGGDTAAGGSNLGGSGAIPSNARISDSQVFQTMDGLGVSINVHSWDGGDVIPALQDLEEMGTHIWRVVYEMSDWEATNDDDDPSNFDWNSYDEVFTSDEVEELWSTIAWLNDNGHSSDVMLDFMGRAPEWMGGATLEISKKEEFVETILAITHYGAIERGLEFGMLAPSNETDHDGIEGPQISASDYADILNQVAVGLDDMGLEDLKLVGPDTANGMLGVDWYMPAMMGYPNLMAHVDVIAIHAYSPNINNLMPAIAASAYPDARGWVTETSYADDALYFIENGASAVLLWDGFDSVYRHAELAGRGSEPPNDAGPGPAALSIDEQGRYQRRDTYYEWKQLARYILPGMQRILATSDVEGVSLLAFRHRSNGVLTVVGRNRSPGAEDMAIDLGGLNDGVVVGYATNGSQKFERLDLELGGNVVSFTAPGSSFFTLTTDATQ